jgi:hypothetical protein
MRKGGLPKMDTRSVCWLPFLLVAFSACGSSSPGTDAGDGAVRTDAVVTSDVYQDVAPADDAPVSDVPATTMTYTATLNGASEIPPVATTATGQGTFTFNTTTRQITYNVTHNVANANAAHIHPGSVTQEGAPIVPFASAASPISGSATLTPDQATALMAGNLYVNIHSPTYPEGEIRGQILPQ